MTEERSVTFTARDIADALTSWAMRKGVPIPSCARLEIVRGKPRRPASATLTWRKET